VGFVPSRLSLCRSPELLKPERQPLPIGTILIPPWQLDCLPDDPLQPEFEKRTIMDFEQPIGHVNSVIGVDLDQVSIEGRMVDLR
jgi:hypothetical protein